VLILPKVNARQAAIIVAIIISICGLSLNFRARAVGDTGLDFQNSFKLIVWTCLFFVSLISWRRYISYCYSLAGFAITTLSCLMVVSSLWSLSPFYTLACGLGFVSYVGLGALAARYLTVDTVLVVLMGSLAVFVSLGFLFAGTDLAWLPPSSEETVYRLQGLAATPNGFGHASAIYIAASALCLWRRTLSPVMCALNLGLGLTGLILSGNRTIQIALVGSVILVLIRSNKALRLKAILASIVPALGVAIYAAGMAPDFTSIMRLMSRTGAENEILTLTGRTEIWSTAFHLFIERPVLGWGFNATEALMMNNVPLHFYGSMVNAHNMYLQLALSLGTVGLLLCLTVTLCFMRAYVIDPLPLRDFLFFIFFINGLTEADYFATPDFNGMIIGWLIYRDILRARFAEVRLIS
jgi:O-antigen ligase